ncbi:dihydrodipicolinate synthase family protein [Bacillaceae bacterium SIJ1]|uniref:dihydrodipicolinate synthase family protein n=1 Tax=Litoribacterium kuwaitense TaxID=1398745 RepID=UPI0013ED7255|nr:dihydrodipicolinate synthase family protein [Litoribacterium kuwaitense]NGP45752.1 dihydrodipicolinate synthase family protein [Litoribacterium kuwaitense]
MKKLFGVTTAMVTPMYANGEVNYSETAKLTEFLISKGVDCLYPLGTTGEMLKLSLEERKEVAETVIRAANQRVPVFVHIGAMTVKETLVLAEHAVQAGADGIGVVTPIYFPASGEDIEHYYATIANALPKDFPIYLYSIPQLSGNELPVKVVKRLAESYPNIVGMKYSYPDFLMLKDYLSIRSNDFSVLTGTDALFVPALAMGCDGVVSGVSSVYPEPFVHIYRSFQAMDLNDAREMQRHADRIIKILQAGANIAYFKSGLEHRGIKAGSVKGPQQDLNKRLNEELVQELNEWISELSEKKLMSIY